MRLHFNEMFRVISPDVSDLTPDGVRASERARARARARACVRACLRVCVCVWIIVNSLGQMEPVSWLKAASDKLKKPDKRSRKEVYNRYFDNSQRLLRSALVWVLNPNSLPFPYQQTHALTCLFASPYLTYQRKAFTTTSFRLAYKK